MTAIIFGSWEEIKLKKSHDWIKRIYNHFFLKDIFTYEILSAEDIESYRRLSFHKERDINKRGVNTDNTTWTKLSNENQKFTFLASGKWPKKDKTFNRAWKQDICFWTYVWKVQAKFILVIIIWVWRCAHYNHYLEKKERDIFLTF